MKIAVVYTALAIAVFGAALYLRLADLDNRPMHCDEAVHGIKFGRLLQQNDYVYDPREYHGPSLNYLTLPVAKCLSRSALTDVTESDLRLVPAITGVLLVVMVWCLRREVGTPVTLCAMALTALSPAMVFYSRYYIQEMVLVGFTFGAMVSVIRFRRIAARMQPWDETASPGRWRLFFWAVTFGVCIAMMHASKETSVIALFAMVVAAFVSFRKRPLLARRRVLQYAALGDGRGCLRFGALLLVVRQESAGRVGLGYHVFLLPGTSFGRGFDRPPRVSAFLLLQASFLVPTIRRSAVDRASDWRPRTRGSCGGVVRERPGRRSIKAQLDFWRCTH